MPLTWNGVVFHETPLVDGGPDFSFLPLQESRYAMRGWFDWNDVVSQRASIAFAGLVEQDASYVPIDGNGVLLPNLALPDPTLNYFHNILPLIHPDWPNQMYLCEGFSQVRGSVPNKPAIGPFATATYDEAYGVLAFRSPRDGYRVLPDWLVLDLVGGAGRGPQAQPAGYIPREYFCTRNMEIVQVSTAKAQTIPADTGLYWQAAPAGGQPVVLTAKCVSAAQFFMTYEGDITIKWYPVPLTGWNEAAALDLIGKCNDAPFPPTQPALANLPGGPPPLSLLSAKGGQKALATLVWGQPAPRIIRMGDCSWAYEITMKLKHYPHGANAFFWHNPPPGVTGRIRIDPQSGPTQDNTLGGPGYYLSQRPDGTFLFPPGNFRTAFLPNGMTV